MSQSGSSSSEESHTMSKMWDTGGDLRDLFALNGENKSPERMKLDEVFWREVVEGTVSSLRAHFLATGLDCRDVGGKLILAPDRTTTLLPSPLEVFSGVETNPTIEMVEQGLRKLHSEIYPQYCSAVSYPAYP